MVYNFTKIKESFPGQPKVFSIWRRFSVISNIKKKKKNLDQNKQSLHILVNFL